MDYQGVLKKKSPKSFLGISIWQDRLFVIGDKSIKYFKTDSSSSKLENASAGEITMDSIVLVKGRHRSVEFQIHCNTDRVYELAAQSIAYDRYTKNEIILYTERHKDGCQLYRCVITH